MKSELNSVDQYIALQPEPTRTTLERVRHAIRKAVPKAQETISYKIPAYRVHGEMFLYFAGWKKHYSLYPITPPVIAAFRKELAAYEVNNKGTLRLPLSAPVPDELIARIAKFCAREIKNSRKEASSKRRA
jgi:uncharacterized protein YdhG (YjbR/CyaY superfamily)